jgi:micrococcal nuclease
MGKRVGKPGPLVPVLSGIAIVSLFLNGFLIVRDFSRFRVVSVPDGDSIDLADGRRVRLLGLDAPERGRCSASESTELLRNLTLGRSVRLKNTVKDDYGRILADVIVQPRYPGYLFQLAGWVRARLTGTSYAWHAYVNAEMVETGSARYRSAGGPYGSRLSAASAQAQSARAGIWSPSCRGSDPPDPARPVKGNVRAGQRHYQLPGCKNYDQTIVDLSYGDVWFATGDEAAAAGFSPAACR